MRAVNPGCVNGWQSMAAMHCARSVQRSDGQTIRRLASDELRYSGVGRAMSSNPAMQPICNEGLCSGLTPRAGQTTVAHIGASSCSGQIAIHTACWSDRHIAPTSSSLACQVLGADLLVCVVAVAFAFWCTTHSRQKLPRAHFLKTKASLRYSW